MNMSNNTRYIVTAEWVAKGERSGPCYWAGPRHGLLNDKARAYPYKYKAAAHTRQREMVLSIMNDFLYTNVHVEQIEGDTTHANHQHRP
jgi:hypothetical protein